MKNHERVEKNVGLLALFMVIAVSIGGLVQIVPLFFQDLVNEPVTKVNDLLNQVGEKLEIKRICTNDTHFLDEESADAHELLICLSTGRDPEDPALMRYFIQITLYLGC